MCVYIYSRWVIRQKQWGPLCLRPQVHSKPAGSKAGRKQAASQRPCVLARQRERQPSGAERIRDLTVCHTSVGLLGQPTTDQYQDKEKYCAGSPYFLGRWRSSRCTTSCGVAGRSRREQEKSRKERRRREGEGGQLGEGERQKQTAEAVATAATAAANAEPQQQQRRQQQSSRPHQR